MQIKLSIMSKKMEEMVVSSIKNVYAGNPAKYWIIQMISQEMLQMTIRGTEKDQCPRMRAK